MLWDRPPGLRGFSRGRSVTAALGLFIGLPANKNNGILGAVSILPGGARAEGEVGGAEYGGWSEC